MLAIDRNESSEVITSLSRSVFFVKPDVGSQCTSSMSPCFTLRHYVTNSGKYFLSNSTFKFLDGVHHLYNTSMVSIVSVSNISFVGSISTTVQCSGEAGFAFVDSFNVAINRIVFTECSAFVKDFSWYLGGKLDNWAALYFKEISNFNISHVTVTNSTGYGLLIYNPSGSSSVEQSTFQYNSGVLDSRHGGNAIILYTCEVCHPMMIFHSMLRISSSKFLYGQEPNSDESSLSPGVAIAIMCCNVHIELDDVLSKGNMNASPNGGNMYVLYEAFTNISILIRNSTFSHGNNTGFTFSTSDYMSFTDPLSCGPSTTEVSPHTLLSIINCIFYSNKQYGFYVNDHETAEQQCLQQVILIEDTLFLANTVVTYTAGVALFVHRRDHLPAGLSPDLQVIVINTTFANSTGTSNGYLFSAVLVLTDPNVTFIDCTFRDNNMSAILAFHSNIVLGGNTNFLHNHANMGGGIILVDDSYMFLKPNARINFEGNEVAYVGGAIYADNTPQVPLMSPQSFFQIDIKTKVTLDIVNNISCDIVNNTAQFAGSGIYGYPGDMFQFRGGISAQTIFNTIFHLKNNKPQSSSIADVPIGVCLCNKNVNCKQDDAGIHVYPGEIFHIDVVIISSPTSGEFAEKYSRVPGAVQATTMGDAALAPLQNLQQVNSSECTTLHFSVFSVEDKTIIELTAQRPRYLQASAYSRIFRILVSLKECPPGFELSNNSRMCNCSSALVEIGTTCFIADQNILRTPQSWIGFIKQTQLIYNQRCPYDYCIKHAINITINNTELQCASNRSGFLCGQCQSGLSVILGSSSCKLCSNKYIVLLVVFALAGIALVVFLVVTNLTISTGCISGLLFYANVIKMNEALFFPPSSYYNVISMFVSWINLDLGIETCFFDGMDNYIYTWLQFVFPLYIWIIMLLIIFLSWRVTFIARMVDRNAVQVLATLLLLSYTKIQRTIINAVSFAKMILPDHAWPTVLYVWPQDGNITYLMGKHIILFMAACITFLLAVVPFMLTLLFVCCLQANTHRRCLGWVQRLKPLLDAYGGPHKDNCRFWTGLLLLMRTILSVVFTAGEPNMSLLAITIAVITIIGIQNVFYGVYRSRLCDLLELFFIFNLGVLSVTTLYIINTGGNQNIATYLSGATALLGFVCITFYHLVIFRACHTAACCKSVIFKAQFHSTADNQPENECLIPATRELNSASKQMSGVSVIRLDIDGNPVIDQREENRKEVAWHYTVESCDEDTY